MMGLGSAVYYFYNLSLAAGTDESMHPYPEWTYEAYFLIASYGQFFVLWLFNLILDHNGNFLDRLLIWDLDLMLLAPIAALVGVFYTSSSYGTISEVALGTDWAITIDDDEHYNVIFNGTILMAILNFIFEITARPAIKGLYR